MAKLSNIKCIDSLIYKSNDKVAKTRPPLMEQLHYGRGGGELEAQRIHHNSIAIILCLLVLKYASPQRHAA